MNAALAIFCLTVGTFLALLYGSDVGKDDGCIDVKPNQTINISCILLSEALEMFSQESNVSLNLKCLFFANVILQFVSMSCNILVIPSEFKIFRNEHHNNWYSTGSYYWSKYVIEIPFAIIISFIYSIIMFYGTGQLSEIWRFAYFALIIVNKFKS